MEIVTVDGNVLHICFFLKNKGGIWYIWEDGSIAFQDIMWTIPSEVNATLKTKPSK